MLHFILIINNLKQNLTTVIQCRNIALSKQNDLREQHERRFKRNISNTKNSNNICNTINHLTKLLKGIIMKSLIAVLILAATNTAFAGELEANAAKTADYKICGDVFVVEGQSILGSKLKQQARVIAWTIYKNPAKLREKYVFDHAYTMNTSKLLSLSKYDLSEYCNLKYINGV